MDELRAWYVAQRFAAATSGASRRAFRAERFAGAGRVGADRGIARMTCCWLVRRAEGRAEGRSEISLRQSPDSRLVIDDALQTDAGLLFVMLQIAAVM